MKLFSVRFNDTAISLALLILRVAIGVLMAFYGYHKLMHFSEMANSDFWNTQINFLGQGGKVSLALTVFAELVCSVLLIFGLFTRLSLIPLLICMGYIVAIFDKYKIISSGENGLELNSAFFYFLIYIVLFLTGPGIFSIDRFISKK